jgi:hypothetical protein
MSGGWVLVIKKKMANIIIFLKNIKFTKHDRLFDMWSVTHFLTGTMIGSLFSFFDFNLVYSALIAFCLLMCWEIYEFIKKTGESYRNSISDVFVGIVGFFFSYNLLFNHNLNDKVLMSLLFLFLNTVMIIWGKSTKRKKD